MKYNKQLFDQIETEYNQVLNLCEFIFDNLIEKNDEIKNMILCVNLIIIFKVFLPKLF